MVWPVDDFVEMGRLVTEIAVRDPISFVLVLLGSLLIVFSLAAFGYLSLGAAVDLVTPESIGRPPERRA